MTKLTFNIGLSLFDLKELLFDSGNIVHCAMSNVQCAMSSRTYKALCILGSEAGLACKKSRASVQRTLIAFLSNDSIFMITDRCSEGKGKCFHISKTLEN